MVRPRRLATRRRAFGAQWGGVSPPPDEPDESDTADEDELLADVQFVFDELVADKRIELASRRGSEALAIPAVLGILADDEYSLSDWLLDRSEVGELYAEEEELRHRFRRVVARMRGETARTHHHPELAAAILADPANEEAWTVYADWLQEQGDPRGELMMLQLKRKSRPNARLQRAEKQLLARYRRLFFGSLPESRNENGAAFTVRYGFFDTAKIRHHVDLAELLHLESGRFLSTLTIHCDLSEADAVLAETALPASLVSLVLGKHFESGRANGRYAWGPRETLDVERATRGLSRLESLHLATRDVTLRALALPKLRELSIACERIAVETTAFAELPALTHLQLSALTVTNDAGLLALFHKPPPELRSIAIRDIDKVETGTEAAALLDVILKAPIAKQLRSLAMTNALLTTANAQKILDAKPNLPVLEVVDLSKNGLTPGVRTRLATTWRSIAHEDD